MLNHHKLNVTCWDTAGLEEYDGIRKLVYKNAHMVVITFAINDSDSLENVEEKVPQYTAPSFLQANENTVDQRGTRTAPECSSYPCGTPA